VEIKTQLLLGVLLIGLISGVALGYVAFKPAPESGAVEGLGEKMEGFINANLLRPGLSARVENVSRIGELYQLSVRVSSGNASQIVPAYASGDGELFFPDFINTSRRRESRSQPQSAEIDMQGMVDDDPASGSRDAKVIIVEFSDFQCPFCAKAAPVVKKLRESYGDEILLVYRDFPLSSIHPLAEKAAEAAQCAYEQKAFWSYHDLLFERQEEWSAAGVGKFKEYARELGLDGESFDTCLDSGRYAAEVAKDLQEGQHFGVTGTPTFFINGRKLEGAQPYSAFKTIIDQELSKNG